MVAYSMPRTPAGYRLAGYIAPPVPEPPVFTYSGTYPGTTADVHAYLDIAAPPKKTTTSK